LPIPHRTRGALRVRVVGFGRGVQNRATAL
jgi:hypothetical protein